MLRAVKPRGARDREQLRDPKPIIRWLEQQTEKYKADRSLLKVLKAE
jgi:hypothetical protein